MDIMDAVDGFSTLLWTIWTLWTPLYDVDKLANEWGAKGRRFKSSRPDLIIYKVGLCCFANPLTPTNLKTL